MGTYDKWGEAPAPPPGSAATETHGISVTLICVTIIFMMHDIQDSLANAKVSARQPWYIGHNSLNHPCEVAQHSEVIQGHGPWCKSKAHMQLPISHY